MYLFLVSAKDNNVERISYLKPTFFFFSNDLIPPHPNYWVRRLPPWNPGPC